MYIKKSFILILCTFMVISCNKDMFDAEEYKQLAEKEQPVDYIDASHTWELTTDYSINVETNNVVPEAKRLLILSGDPTSGRSSNILGEYILNGDDKMSISFVAPSTLQKFFAALVDDEENYTVTSFSSSNPNVDFTQPIATKKKVDSRLIGLQTFSYCFEEEIPQPGDYDYNDVILNISQERTSANQLTFNVTLSAVGSLAQIAAAIRLVDYKVDDITSIETTDGKTFDDGYKKSTLPFIEGNDLKIRGLNQEAIINLFEDAHWATGATSYASEGYVERRKYNVSKTTSSTHDMMSPRTISFVVTFENTNQLNHFTLNQLDPFIIVEYNGVLMENHAAYKYRLASILHEYTQPSNANILPWALIIPSNTFRYPLDGVNIGSSRSGKFFGAYMTSGHSFGEWAAKKDNATDWYNYPNDNMVY